MKRESLLYASSDFSADMLYFAKAFVPDAFFAFTFKGKKCALVHPLEIGRLRAEADFDECFDASEISKKYFTRTDADTAAALFRYLGVSCFKVSADFPSLQLERLRAGGIDVEVLSEPLFASREVKTPDEIRNIKKSNAVAAACYKAISEILAESKISGAKLMWRGKPLTSQIAKYELEKIALSMNAEIKRTILACADQACDPHCEGYGFIKPNSLIVVDIFPRLKDSGYYGDMTRTFLKGSPNSAQERLVKTVLAAQKIAIKGVKAGCVASSVHGGVCDFFESKGYFTEFKNGAWGGFFHGTGHGVGLDIHEAPRLGLADNILKENSVVTVEPGLYYRGLGGCRIEDCVLVCKDGAKKLSKYNYDWVIA